jgi:uncharacterized protein (DUF1501 family)
VLIKRRAFLKSSLALVPAYAFLPTVFQRAVASSFLESSSASSITDRTLIVVQMAGGNDGLNTVVPYTDGRYYDFRSDVAISQNDVLPLNDQVGLNPSLGKFKELWDEGIMAIVEGVGYPNPNYSHFESMHIWQTADREGKFSEGWLGKYFETLERTQKNAFQGMAVGRILPPECSSPHATIPVVESVALYQLLGDPRHQIATPERTEALLKLYASSPREAPYAVLLDNTVDTAYRSSQSLQAAHQTYSPAVNYPDTPLAQGLKLLAEAITSNLGIKVGHVTLGGFDTHAQQVGEQANLLQTLSEGLHAFYMDLKAHDKDKNVVVMTWSEFGRRVTSNASNGTDHGSAAPMFILGTPVTGGFYGERPDLGNLDNGNLRFTTDFRTVYATILEQWLGAPAEAILGGHRFDTLPILTPN